MESLARDHPFIDGNKRTAAAATALFLEMNGFRLEVSQKELVDFALAMAVGKMADSEAVVWPKKHVVQKKT